VEEKISSADIYFDDAGYTGEDFDNNIQRNYFLSAVVIPQNIKVGLWKELNNVWEISALITNKNDHDIELKGNQLYDGRGIFKSVALDD
jgi:hypothetical protein